MDQVLLVENQLADGQKLVEHLVREGFDVMAAGWIKTCDDDQWYLYLVAPAALKEGPLKSYRRVYTLLQQMPSPFWVEPLEVKVLDTKDRLAKAMLAAQQRYGSRLPSLIRETQLGDVSIDGVYLYPPTTVGDRQQATAS